MTSVWFNRKFKDDVERRERLYAGEIVVYDCLSAVKEFAEFTARMVETALAPHDPRSIHEVLSSFITRSRAGSSAASSPSSGATSTTAISMCPSCAPRTPRGI